MQTILLAVSAIFSTSKIGFSSYSAALLLVVSVQCLFREQGFVELNEGDKM